MNIMERICEKNKYFLLIPTHVFNILSVRFIILSDQNECFEDKGGCKQSCHNTMGGFECQCSQGYSLDFDEKSCKCKYTISESQQVAYAKPKAQISSAVTGQMISAIVFTTRLVQTPFFFNPKL